MTKACDEVKASLEYCQNVFNYPLIYTQYHNVIIICVDGMRNPFFQVVS